MARRKALSAASLERADPRAQVHRLLERDQYNGGKLTFADIPPIPEFRPQSRTEILLLRPPTSLTTTLAFVELWKSIRPGLKDDLRLDPLTVEDVTGQDPPPMSWVGFDPCGILIDSEQDFRADVLARKVGADYHGVRNPSQDMRPVEDLAGLEVFFVLSTMESVLEDAWVKGREVALYVTIPRLEAKYPKKEMVIDHKGVVCLEWWPKQGGIDCYSQYWEYNYYGHDRAVPTIRQLS